ncbi:MAG: Threonylcarbamoyl-AMP synthase [Verrucomicrobiae bacterium]|nr:Threonylcarbamoyl-AMP synthase [Verrucomicrobiae bacterium]
MAKTTQQIVNLNPVFPQRIHLQAAATILRQGGLVAFPTETVYGLGADALNKDAVAKIFTAKNRPGWDPLIVHVRDIEMAKSLAKELPAHFLTLAGKFWPGPLTLVVERSARIPDEVTAGRSTVGLRMPKHPVAASLLAEASLPIAAPSANKFGRTSATRAEHVLDDLGKSVDMILDAGPTTLGVESTVLDLTQSPPAILRPGGVTREELEAVIGPVTLAPSVADELAKRGVASPGMTTQHYAPRGQVELFEGDREDVTNRLIARAIDLRNRGHKVAAYVSDEMVPAVTPVTELVSSFGKWGDWERMARRLFAALRVFDKQEMAIILCVLPPATGLGLAVRDRLQRAAGKK